jgi:type IV secretion system protein VirB10
MQAVLESALDSTRGGFARAIVTRDIFGFDGSRILVQRGSRILGQYKSDVSSGQSRILIQWQRLTRPDGVIVDLDSPSADPLGRAGVKGSVNTHFFERFGGAILQSTLDVGVQLATRAASRDTVVVALPGSFRQAAPIGQAQQIQPTVKVKQGTSVSVFVAQDLDFTSVDK